MHAILPLVQTSDFPVIVRGQLDTVQVNLGYRCNQACLHCHVNACNLTILEEPGYEDLADYLAESPPPIIAMAAPPAAAAPVAGR